MLRFTSASASASPITRGSPTTRSKRFRFAQGLIDTGVVHLPPCYAGGKLPVVIAIPGMDSFKETSVALANDRWLMRGVAWFGDRRPASTKSAARPLCVDAELDRCRSRPGGLAAGRPEIDAQKIGITGSSFGCSSEPF